MTPSVFSDDSIVAIVTAVIGSGGLGGLTGWLTQHLARKRPLSRYSRIFAM